MTPPRATAEALVRAADGWELPRGQVLAADQREEELMWPTPVAMPVAAPGPPIHAPAER